MKHYNITQNSGGRVILLEALPINILSFFGNLLVIFLTFTSPELKEHSRYFIANTAFLDLGYSICSVYYSTFHSIFYYFNIEITVAHCTLVMLSSYSFGGATLLSYVSTAICRFSEVIQEKECSKMRRI